MPAITSNIPDGFIISVSKNAIWLTSRKNCKLQIFVSSASAYYHSAKLVSSESIQGFSSDDYYTAPSLAEIIRNSHTVNFQNEGKIQLISNLGNLNLQLVEGDESELAEFFSNGFIADSPFHQATLQGKKLGAGFESVYADVAHERVTDPNGLTGIGPRNSIHVFLDRPLYIEEKVVPFADAVATA